MNPLTCLNCYKNVENQKVRKVKILRSDRDGEYFPNEFSIFCEEHGLIHQSSTSYILQQNGLTKRKNRTLIDMVNAMILSAELPFNLWKEALLTAYHVHNRVPSKKIKVSPYKLWNKRKPNLDYTKVWGCLTFYRVADPKRTKLRPRAMKNMFVGNAKNSKAYRLFDLSFNTMVESRGVEFIEDKFSKDSMDALIPTQTQQGDSNPNTILGGTKRIESSSPSEQRKSQGIRKEKKILVQISFLIKLNCTLLKVIDKWS